ncbi:MAG: YerC/YecD family TrpR-related protein [Lachnospiraceae bacterium]|nr:YerC/YecD family TrpR-related protein [Lachnospiraceae bacterium]MDY5742116.1 YerC/YecD family TrpR-related protein [Lachnospiraceae bacterium]
MNKELHTKEMENLFRGILTLETVEECFDFFQDFCTINELLSLSQRFEVAGMLRKKQTYLEVAKQTGASTATISRVNRCLVYGNGSYEMVYSRLEKQNGADTESEA